MRPGRTVEARTEGFRRLFRLGVILGVLCLLVAATAVGAQYGVQYLREAKLTEAKALAGSALTALQGCLHAKGPGATCTLAEVAGRISVNPSGATPDGRWIVGAGSALTLESGGNFTGVITVSGVSGRDTDNTSLALYATPSGRMMRCDTTSRVPPGISGGQPC